MDKYFGWKYLKVHIRVDYLDLESTPRTMVSCFLECIIVCLVKVPTRPDPVLKLSPFSTEAHCGAHDSMFIKGQQACNITSREFESNTIVLNEITKCDEY